MVEIPPGLLEQIERGQVVLFVGENIIRDDNGRFPIDHLTALLIAGSGLEAVNFMEAAQLYEDTHGRQTLIHFLHQHVPPNPQETHQLLAALTTCDLLVTTRFDDAIARAFAARKRPLQVVAGDAEATFTAEGAAQLFPLCGAIGAGEPLVLTEDDWERFFEDTAAIPAVLQGHLAQKSILFLGFDVVDPYFKRLYRKVTAALDNRQQRDFIVADKFPARASRWCRRHDIAEITAAAIDFLRAVSDQLQTRARPETAVSATPPPALDSRPYKRLDFYRAQDAPFFFGRQQEIQQLSSLIHAHRLVLLYGASGTGKTSLLLAGVVPFLGQTAARYKFIYVRAFLEEPSLTIGRLLQRELPLDHPQNQAPVQPRKPRDLLALRRTIHEAFNESELRDLCAQMGIEYEDLSGTNRRDRARELITYFERRGRLAELVDVCALLRPQLTWPGHASQEDGTPEDGTAPQALLESVRAVTDALNTTLVIVLDQFEDLFNRFDLRQRAAFFRELGLLYNDTGVPIKFVLSLREEWLAYTGEMEPYIAEIFRTRMRLLPLSRQQARQAITGPVERLEIAYEPALVERLLDDLMRGHSGPESAMVMPPQLQLVCHALYERALAGNGRITLADYEALGGVPGVLGRYLEEELRRFMPQERQLVRAVLEEMVSSERTKRVVTCDELALVLETERSQLNTLLGKLVDAQLIRPLEQEYTIAYELVHHYLAHEITITPDTQARKAVEEMVAQELRNWHTLQTLISPERLEIIGQWRQRLHLSQKAEALIEKSLQKKELDEREQLRAIQADRMLFLNRLVAGIDKEITSPISAIKSNSHFLRASVAEIQDSLPNEVMADAWSDIDEIAGELEIAAEQMVRLIKALSNFAQPDRNGFKRIDLHATLRAALLLLEHQMIREGITVDYRHQGHAIVAGSAAQLMQLFMNVLMSCVEAIKEKNAAPTLQMEVRTGGRWGIITFVHRGEAFKTADFYELFKQTAASETENVRHGLGLSIAYQIVQRHRGTIEILPKTTDETALAIKLPLADLEDGDQE